MSPKDMSPKKKTKFLSHAEELRVPIFSAELSAFLAMPDNPRGLVIFVHGSGSGRHSPRNQFVAQEFFEHGLASLLFDLLTPEEESIDESSDEQNASYRFDIPFLATRLSNLTRWVLAQPRFRNLPLGYFGASTGAAAALVAAAEHPQHLTAVVSRGGRADLAGAALGHVQAPTLLIVGELDPKVLLLNQRALEALGGPARLELVAGATHLFEEAGALERVARLACDWFERYLSASEIWLQTHNPSQLSY
jgi:putative phosphoribosyl transferase